MTDLEYIEKYAQNKEDAKQRLLNGEPVQYIIGNVDFYGYKINVNKNVLIPRFETEELVSKTINYINKYFDKPVDILDIGTGSGCISIALNKKINNSNITAIDISSCALEVAKQNAEENKCNIRFIQSDLFNNVSGNFDVIISNPPYISYDEKIMDIVKNNEPHIALYADDNGLYFYKKILDESKKFLKSKNIIAFEIGYLQADKIKEYAYKIFKDAQIIVEKDLQGKDRYIFIFNEIN